MSVFYSFVLAFIFNFLGMCCFALTIERHQRIAADWKILKDKKILFKKSGWFFIFISLAFCVTSSAISMAILLWIMLLTTAGMAVAVVLSFCVAKMMPLHK
jgi:sensor histidine kinase YesM